MELMDAILTRRSIRKYSKQEIAKEEILELLKAGMYAPSAVNKQPWEFVVFSDETIIEEIISVHKNAKMLLEANVAILVCYDEDQQHDEGYGPVDCSAATQNILLAAHSRGLGACWIGIYPRENRMLKLKELFGLPKNIVPFSVISLGKPSEIKEQPQRYNPKKVHFDKW